MNDMSINAGIASGALSSALQQQAMGAELINKTLQGQGIVAEPAKAVAANPPHKGNSLDIRV